MKVYLSAKSQRQLERLPKELQVRIGRAVNKLESNPWPFGSLKLTSQEGYRLRLSDYRILYFVDKERGQILVTRIAHRREAYR